MKTKLLSLALLLAALTTRAADPEPLARLDAALKDAAAFKYGDPDAALKTVEEVVVAAAKDRPLRPQVEQRLLKALDARPSRDMTEILCRQLVIIGSGAAVPKLESMLTDPETAHLARYALGRLESSDAPAALQRALARTSGRLQAGAINSLGKRRYAPAAADIARLLASPDPVVAEAAVAALGDIAGPDSARALSDARGAAPTDRRLRIDHALLACGDAALKANQADAAAALFEPLYAADRAKPVRVAALRGLAVARGAAITTTLVDAIKGTDPALASPAIGFTRLVKGEGLSKTLADLLPTLPAEKQEVLVRALADRGDAPSSAAVMAATNSADPKVRSAAIESLGDVGGASAVAVLAAVAAKGGDDQRLARESLIKLKGDAINATLLQAVPAAEPKTRAELVRALGARRASTATADIKKLTADPDPAVRKEAIGALGQVAAESDLPTLINLAIKPTQAGDRGAVEDACAAAFRRLGNPAKRTALVLDALAAASTDAKPYLIRLLKAVGSPDAVQALRSFLKDPAQEIQDAAIRTLSDWPDPAPADDLLALATSAPSPTQKILALRGYVRLAGLAAQPVPMYTRAMAAAQRPDEKKMVLGGLGSQNSLGALRLAEKSLADEAVQNEAAQAVISVANKLRGKDADQAKPVLQSIATTVKNDKIKKQAEDTLKKLNAPADKPGEKSPQGAEKPTPRRRR